MRWAIVVAVVLIAGCDHPAAPKATPDAATTSEGILHGAVLDPALRPLSGAQVSVAGLNASAASDQQGIYRFDGLPRGQVLIVTAAATGFKIASRQTTLPEQGDTRLDLVLEPLPSVTGYLDVLKFSGLIGCQAALVVSQQLEQSVDCGQAADPGNTVWDFQAAPALASAIIEITWSPQTPLADGLGARLDEVQGTAVHNLTQGVGRSPLRLVVPFQTAARLFAAGGQMRLTVFAAPITAEDEQAAAVSLDADQAFEAFASLFYVVAPEPTYSFVNGTR